MPAQSLLVRLPLDSDASSRHSAPVMHFHPTHPMVSASGSMPVGASVCAPGGVAAAAPWSLAIQQIPSCAAERALDAQLVVVGGAT